MNGFTIQQLGKIRNKWVTDFISETMCTFLFTLFVLCAGAQSFLTYGEKSSVVAQAFAGGVGLMCTVYCGLKASGAPVNPNVSIMFCLLGKMQWKKLPLYIIAELIGAFLAAGVTYFLHKEMIVAYEDGQLAVNGSISTAHLFTSLPEAPITRITAFFDIVIGTAVLDACIAGITDAYNANVHSGVIPLVFAIMLPGILFAFSANLGCVINSGVDFSGRLFAAMVYGSHVFQHWHYWFWIPIVAGILGSVIGSFFYQLGIGNHLIPEQESTKGTYSSVEKLDDCDC